MKLMLYGGGHDFENRTMDSELIRLAGNIRSNLKITYIPAESYMSHADFAEFVQQYRSLGVTKFLHFPVDVPFTQVLQNEAFSSDIIHLSGGNTFSFLYNLRKKRLLPVLRKYVKDGGVLTGVSAGAIMMTPTIATASFPEFDRDDNDENLTNLNALGLVNFEFFPHYRNSQRYQDALLAHSLTIPNPIYGCPDGSGIVVNNDKTTFVGKVHCFHQGKKFLLRG